MNIRLKLFTLLSGSLALFSCGEGDEGKDHRPTIPVMVLQSETIESPQNYVADIQAVQFVEIKPKVEGFILDIYVDEGERVTKGQPLFRISSIEQSEEVDVAQANYKKALAELKMAEYEATRMKRLVSKDIMSSVRLEQIQAELEVAQMKVQQASAQMHRAQTMLSYATITAPYSGYIDRIPYKKGSLVHEGDLLTSITDVSEVFAYFKVNEREYLRYKRELLAKEESNMEQGNNGGSSLSEIQTSLRDSVDLILGDGTLYNHKGVIEIVEGDFERGTGSIAFRARFPNPEGLLKHGGTGKVQVNRTIEGVCLIPQRSTFDILDYTYVYTVDSTGIVRIRSFIPLSRYGSFYATKDLEAGTTIVYEGLQEIKDEVAIKKEMVDPLRVLEDNRQEEED